MNVQASKIKKILKNHSQLVMIPQFSWKWNLDKPIFTFQIFNFQIVSSQRKHFLSSRNGTFWMSHQKRGFVPKNQPSMHL